MGRSDRRRGFFALAACLASLAGCGGGVPSVSSSMTEATVRGTVKYKGQPVTEGEIVFDPTNINRRSASIASAKIGKDGTYSVKTLVGANSVNFKLPRLGRQDSSLEYATFPIEVGGGENTKDFELPKP